MHFFQLLAAATLASAFPGIGKRQSGCSYTSSFSIAVNGQFLSSGQDGQLYANSANCTSFSIDSSGHLNDTTQGYQCYIAGPSGQLECAMSPSSSAGSMTSFCVSNNMLTYNGNSTFYTCDSKIYGTPQTASGCQAVSLTVTGANCQISSSTMKASTVVSTVISTVQASPVTKTQTVVSTMQASPVTKTQTVVSTMQASPVTRTATQTVVSTMQASTVTNTQTMTQTVVSTQTCTNVTQTQTQTKTMVSTMQAAPVTQTQTVVSTMQAAPVTKTQTVVSTMQAAPVTQTQTVVSTMQAAPVTKTQTVVSTMQAAPVTKTQTVVSTMQAAPVTKTQTVVSTMQAAPVTKTVVSTAQCSTVTVMKTSTVTQQAQTVTITPTSAAAKTSSTCAATNTAFPTYIVPVESGKPQGTTYYPSVGSGNSTYVTFELASSGTCQLELLLPPANQLKTSSYTLTGNSVEISACMCNTAVTGSTTSAPSTGQCYTASATAGQGTIVFGQFACSGQQTFLLSAQSGGLTLFEDYNAPALGYVVTQC